MIRPTWPLVVAVLLSACGGEVVTARDAIDVFTAEGLPAAAPQDVTSAACGDIGCLEAVEAEPVTVYRWGDSLQAAGHAQDLEQPAYSLNEFVIAFPVDTEVETSAYADALTEAVKG